MLLSDQILPASLNIADPMEEARGFDLVHDTARSADVHHVVSNAFGFGGVNTALAFRRIC